VRSGGEPRIGLLGCGRIAYYHHLRVLRRLRGATLVAAADPDAEARKRAAQVVRVPIYSRAEDLLQREDIDAVVICVPTHLHAPIALAAAAAGKHFYLEKPIATSVADAESVARAAETAHLIGAMGFNRRFHPLFQQARAFLCDGGLGQIAAVQTAFCEPTPESIMPEWKRHRRSGGGVLLDLGSHHIDLVRWFLNDEVGAVSGSIESKGSDADSASLRLIMRSGVEVQSFFSFRTGMADYLEFIGNRGTLRVDRHRASLVLRVRRRFGYSIRTGWIPPSPSVLRWRLQRLVHPSLEPSYRFALYAFRDALRGQPVELPSLGDGIASLQVILAAEKFACAGDPSQTV
jgi:myo-inositol 2-dehydrogenase / D-chiro-inositol 1-dehydrogenase